jgi:hypothetical protein
MRQDLPADGDWAGAAVSAVREIYGALDIKRPLRELGAGRAPLPAGAVAGAVTRNAPRLPDESQVPEILTRFHEQHARAGVRRAADVPPRDVPPHPDPALLGG